MNFKRFLVFLLWSIFTMIAVGIALFFFTYGDCLDVAACRIGANRRLALVLVSGFLIYWIVAIALFRRWNR